MTLMTGSLANEKGKGLGLFMSAFGTYILFGVCLFAFLISLAWIDFKTFRLPNKLSYPLIMLGLIQSYFLSDIKASILGAGIGYLVFIAVEKGFKALRGKEGLGRGDAKLLAAGGAWCGWSGLPLIVLIASLIGIILAVIPKYRAVGKIPFGPCLAFGIFMVWGAGAYVALKS